MELKETINGMTSADYKERFKAEYYQTKIRYEKLNNMLEKWKNGELDFEPDCPRCLLASQLMAMASYLLAMEYRAIYENIDLEEV